ncbi:T9SS type A sorting domain-containing protein [candidate division KSB1 bacterium]|nr:T9SS type A sorting domain-containing protein [candidate division KSB1 bacterium]NIR73012.1 T9SS type A sorting domain-containing protein [candidate division KSB1 bacterium]NIS26916.1 T9SS type A sorting domain-containing protein [candidate division KSB1 bacterium]NIT73749.1 T9SS type A sorting domain-containing protein [candidate division KSB1 bacterium]NIU27654.1 T9SS type A sorting domain-containing protein [candidate division KSB1 bacterium]
MKACYKPFTNLSFFMLNFTVLTTVNGFAQNFTKITSGPHVIDTNNSAGTSWVDYDGDGDLDIFATGWNNNRNDLYRNNGDGSFTKITGNPLVTDQGPSLGHSWTDADNDGDLDVFVAGNPAFFYLNDGAGGFTRPDKNSVFGTSDIRGFSCAWGDFNNDGFVDLVVTHAQNFHGPPAVPNFLFQNDGNGQFTRIASGPIVTGLSSYTIPSWSDYDLDGDLDLSIGAGPASGVRGRDFFYRNMLTDAGTAQFERLTTGALVEELRDGQIINWIDYDNDRDLDVFITNYGRSNGKSTNDLYRNNGDGTYVKITTGTIVTEQTVSMAQAWGDYDNDGDLDVFVAHCDGNANSFFVNNGDGTFSKLITGPLATDTACSWGGAAGDYDNDGDLDLYVANMGNFNGPPGQVNFLYRNDLNNGNHWIKINAMGTASNHAAIGTKVHARVTINDRPVWQFRDISSQNTLDGHNSFEIHFGLGDATIVDSLVIEWPLGLVETFVNISADNVYRAVEGESFGVDPVSSVDGLATVAVLEGFSLHQNYPNPFNPTTTVTYTLPQASHVVLRVFNLLGEVVRTLVEARKPAGTHFVSWDGRDGRGQHVASGVYLYKIEAEGFVRVKKMVLLE